VIEIGPKTVWRNGRPYDLHFPDPYVPAGAPIDGRFLRALPDPCTIMPNASWPGLVAAHWGYCAPTDVLRGVRGYDERFVKYGPEDSDLVRRLKRQGYTFRYDPQVFALHVRHLVADSGNDEMSALGRRIAHEPPTRNDPNTWGEGGLRAG
jgi:GT2 family glycosyltransferase